MEERGPEDKSLSIKKKIGGPPNAPKLATQRHPRRRALSVFSPYRQFFDTMARGTSGRRKQSVADKQAVNKPKEGNPKSMVIRIGAGEVGSSVSQLVQDMRQVMQPDTAVRLKVGRSVPFFSLDTHAHALATYRNEGRTNFATTPQWRDRSV